MKTPVVAAVGRGWHAAGHEAGGGSGNVEWWQPPPPSLRHCCGVFTAAGSRSFRKIEWVGPESSGQASPMILAVQQGLRTHCSTSQILFQLQKWCENHVIIC